MNVAETIRAARRRVVRLFKYSREERRKIRAIEDKYAARLKDPDFRRDLAANVRAGVESKLNEKTAKNEK